MAWPFTSSAAPNLDTGPGVDVPDFTTPITLNPAWIVGAHFRNVSPNPVVLLLTNAAGDEFLQITLPGGAEQPYEWPFRPTLGLSWEMNGNPGEVVGHVWGYE